MERRTLIAIMLIIIVFWLSNELIWKNKKPQIESEPSQNIEETATVSVDQTTVLPAVDTAKVIIPESVALPDLEVNNQIILENEHVMIVFSNMGGVVHSIILKDYFLADKINNVNLVPADLNLLSNMITTSEGNMLSLAGNVFSWQMVPEKLQVRFLYQKEDMLWEKIYSLTGENRLELQINYSGSKFITNYRIDFDSGIADTEKYLKMKSRDYKIIAQIDNEITRTTLVKLKEEKQYSGKIDWAAIRSKYFALGIISSDLVNMNGINMFNNGSSPAMKLSVMTNSQQFNHNYTLYLGPLVYDKLKNYGNGFDNILEMGPKFLQWISKIFLVFLKFLNGIVPNWGICIIIFSLLLKVILYPLTHKSFESSHKMQKVQPRLRELQAKYRSDPRTLNVEMKKLYREHGVSPLGGCLPMLLQMPILFALYPILRYSIDLRQTGFLWLHDLSEPDGTMILPIAMAIFMFVQQKFMSPPKATMDKMDEKQQAAMQSQKMMMYFMPVLMFFIFKSLSSGLVLYWTVFSIASTVHQYFIKKRFTKEEK
ncbi:MAG: membrane protein insertase YidC [Candidatus Cloacimonetes bacterium]|nr:membrane protein insertase YidC [Candidatus Cloacimonadota bacterium]